MMEIERMIHILKQCPQIKTFREILESIIDSYAEEKVTYENFGKKIGYSKSTVERWLNGSNIPSHIEDIDRIKENLHLKDKDYAELMRAYICEVLLKEGKKRGILG